MGTTNMVSAVSAVGGFTDNEGCAAALSKLQSTKFPLCCVVMELAARTAAARCRLQLEWTPRESNDEADALSNGRTEGFDPAKRILVDLASVRWLVLTELMESGRQFSQELRAVRAQRHAHRLERKACGETDIPPQHAYRKRAKHERLRVIDPW